MKSKFFYIALTALLVLNTACSKGHKNADPAEGAPSNSATCTNCEGFEAGPTIFSGNVSNGSSHLDGLQIVADNNSLATAAQTYSNPKTQGTYQAMVTGGTLTAVNAACLPDGTYQVQGFKVGSVSANLSVQASSPLWVTLSGPTTVRATMYAALADSNGDDVADAGTKIYLWLDCSGWTRVDLTAP